MKSYLMFLWVNSKVKCKRTCKTLWNNVKEVTYWLTNPFRYTRRKVKKFASYVGQYRREITTFLHISLGAFFIIWGVELFSLWRILLGIYILLWVGVIYLRNIFTIGLYLDPEDG